MSPDQIDQFIQPLLTQSVADSTHLKFANVLMAKVTSKEINTKAQDTLKSHFKTPAVEGPSGKTPLHQAVLKQEISTVTRLLKEGVSCNVADMSGNTPLHYAVSLNNSDLVLLLVQNGANLEARNQIGETPLHGAINNNNVSAVKILLDFHANMTARNNEGQSPLFLAIGLNRQNIVELLLQSGANIEERDPLNLTPLLYAACAANVPLMTYLLNKGANINARGYDGFSIIHFTVVFQDAEMIRFLLNRGANLNALSNDGLPPLSYLLYMQVGVDPSFKQFIETIGGNWNAAQEIIDRKILAHIEGISGESHIDLSDELSIKFSLEGLPHDVSMDKLVEYYESFIELNSTREKWNESSVFEQILSILEKYVDIDKIPSGPFVNSDKTVAGIAAKIRRGEAVVLIGGSKTHAINIIFIDDKIIICNRGAGSELEKKENDEASPELGKKEKVKAGVVYFYPADQVTEEFLSHFTERSTTMKEFQKIFADLKLTPPIEGDLGFNLQKQKVGNCTWASSKTALFALLREYFGEEEQKIYKDFTLYARIRALADYKRNHLSKEKKEYVDQKLVDQAQAQIAKTQGKTPLN